MSTTQLTQFQELVSELLLRHRSILDVLSKLDQAGSSVHRSVVKSITECGCIEINASKQTYSEDWTPEEAREMLQSHVNGSLCENCREVVIMELGKNLFYMSALCNLLDLRLDDVVQSESKKCSTLGFFNLS